MGGASPQPSSTPSGLGSEVSGAWQGRPQDDRGEGFLHVPHPITTLGLAGLDLPNLLIKMAAADLQAEFPYMGIFYTLSPVPGFRRWLEGQLRQKDGGVCISLSL